MIQTQNRRRWSPRLTPGTNIPGASPWTRETQAVGLPGPHPGYFSLDAQRKVSKRKSPPTASARFFEGARTNSRPSKSHGPDQTGPGPRSSKKRAQNASRGAQIQKRKRQIQLPTRKVWAFVCRHPLKALRARRFDGSGSARCAGDRLLSRAGHVVGGGSRR